MRRAVLSSAAALVSGYWLKDRVVFCSAAEKSDRHEQDQIRHCVCSPSLHRGPLEIKLQAVPSRSESAAEVAPPKIGLLDWPAGRVMLQWALDYLPPSAHVLEFGAGIGLVSIGLAMAGTAAEVIATDYDPEVTALMRDNAAANGVQSCKASVDAGGPPSMLVAEWDAAHGAASVAALAALPCDPSKLTHVLGADVVFFGANDDDTPQEARSLALEGAAPDNKWLASTLSALLRAHPHIDVRLICVARTHSLSVATFDISGDLHDEHPRLPVGDSHGEQDNAMIATSSLGSFERQCAAHGLRAELLPLPVDTIRRVQQAQPLHLRAAWWLTGLWDTMVMYKLTLA
jgi:hypothetical protein